MRAIGIVVIVVCVSCTASMGQSMGQNLSLIQGISLEVAPPPQSGAAGDIPAGDFEEAARLAAHTGGWQIDESSDLLITVAFDSVLNRESGKYSVRITVHGGLSDAATLGLAGKPSVFGARTSTRSVEAAGADNSRYLAVMSQLVNDVAGKLRRDYLRQYMVTPTPPPNNNEVLQEERPQRPHN